MNSSKPQRKLVLALLSFGIPYNVIMEMHGIEAAGYLEAYEEVKSKAEENPESGESKPETYVVKNKKE